MTFRDLAANPPTYIVLAEFTDSHPLLESLIADRYAPVFTASSGVTVYHLNEPQRALRRAVPAAPC